MGARKWDADVESRVLLWQFAMTIWYRRRLDSGQRLAVGGGPSVCGGGTHFFQEGVPKTTVKMYYTGGQGEGGTPPPLRPMVLAVCFQAVCNMV